ncbi:MAG: hypothetical protein ACLQUY_25095 [Ktedonobacterales bacterium]
MEQSERDADEEWEMRDSIPPPPHRSNSGAGSGDPGQNSDCSPGDENSTDMEPAWRAAYALMQLKCETLLNVMLRPTFNPIQDTTMVPIYPCPHCGDGGLRTAGTLRLRKGTAFVRACDTCCSVEIGEQQIHS